MFTIEIDVREAPLKPSLFISDLFMMEGQGCYNKSVNIMYTSFTQYSFKSFN